MNLFRAWFVLVLSIRGVVLAHIQYYEGCDNESRRAGDSRPVGNDGQDDQPPSTWKVLNVVLLRHDVRKIWVFFKSPPLSLPPLS